MRTGSRGAKAAGMEVMPNTSLFGSSKSEGWTFPKTAGSAEGSGGLTESSLPLVSSFLTRTLIPVGIGGWEICT